MFKCVNLASHETPEYFLESNLDVKCFENGHLEWALGYSLPIIVILGIFTPIFLLIKLKKAQKSTLPLSLKFLTHGFKEKYYYWEVIVMVRKIALTFVIILMPV